MRKSKRQAKGYEFAYKRFYANSFLKHLGGMNKGRPNEEDLSAATAFANNLKLRAQDG
jgi:hypothetical protein